MKTIRLNDEMGILNTAKIKIKLHRTEKIDGKWGIWAYCVSIKQKID